MKHLRFASLSGFCCLLALVAVSLFAKPSRLTDHAPKYAHSRNGMVATGSPHATAAAVKMLELGGNAMDAAAAACFALMAVDPANTSLGGRAQILLRLGSGRVAAIDGATEAPATVTKLQPGEDRRGFSVAPVPGAMAALDLMVGKYGKLKLADVLQPAIELAENGFAVPPRLAASWASARQRLADDKGAATIFLKADGSAYQAGDLFRQPRLAETLRRIAEFGAGDFYRGAIAKTIARNVEQHGGFIRQKDLERYRAQAGILVRADYRGHQVVSAGGRAWGNTLAEMLNILDHFKIGAEPTAEEIEIIARIIAQAMDDRPQEIGTLKPKAGGYALAQLSSREFAKQRAELIRKKLTPSQPSIERQPDESHDTTHLSVMDAAGNVVSLTTSIGPAFGARVATPELGFLYGHSYRMRSDPAPRSRDLTEMTPTVVFRRGQPVLTIGGAGSERIPTAILQVISNVIDRGWALERAMEAPRIFCLGNKLRMHAGFSAEMMETMRARGFEIEVVELGAARHQGLIHAVSFNPKSGEFTGAADREDSGNAASSAETARRRL